TALYVERDADNQLRRAITAEVKSVYVAGGPRTGKSSLIQRVPDIARSIGRPCIQAKVQDSFPNSIWPKERLSKEQVWKAVGTALSEGSEDFHNLKGGSFSFDSRFGNALHSHLARRPGTIRTLEDFNELSTRAENIEDVGALLYNLFSPSRRNDDNVIIVADDGLAGSIPRVSDHVTRSTVIQISQLDRVCIGDLIHKTLQGTHSDALLANKENVVEQLISAFGSCVFLYHVALHKIRQISEDNRSNYTGESALDEIITNILKFLTDQKKNSNSIINDVDREVEKFAEECLQRINLAAKQYLVFEGGPQALMGELVSGELGSAAKGHYGLPRFLDWSGFAPMGAEIPSYVRHLCQRELA
ncbi:MAG TPA: hypothetical protein DD827_08595, partial [Gammaproteobacteria bacterium]|nr:hypothetical protein [Gammaproteobacteria bacterium]